MKGWHWRTLIAWDSGAAILAGAATLAVGNWYPKVYEQAVSAFLVEAGLGVGIFAVVLGSLTVFATFVTQEYLVVLDRTPTGIAGAFYPYKVIAVVSCATILTGLAGALAWPLLAQNSTVEMWLLAMMSSLTVWCICGTADLVFITAQHGQSRAHLELVLHDKRQEANAKKRAG